MRLNRWVVLSLLFSIYLLGAFMRLQPFDDAINLKYPPYYSEMATHFKYSETIAQGSPLPSKDYSLQHPEGFNIRQRTPVLLYYAVGYLGMLTSLLGISLYTLTLTLPTLTYCISIFTAYLTSRLLFKDQLAGLASAFIYAVSMASISRSLSGFLLYENLALPLIFTHLYFLLKSITGQKNKNTIYYTIISGTLLYLAYMTWKVTGYYFLVLTISTLLACLLTKKYTTKILPPYSTQLSFTILASFTIPYMRHDNQIMNPSILLGLAFILSMLSTKKKIIQITACTLIFTCLIIITPQNPDYSHVSGVYYHKIINLGVKPVDNPASMPYEVRMTWVAGYASPSTSGILLFLTLLPLGAAGLMGIVMKQKTRLKPEEAVASTLTASFTLLYLLSERLSVFTAFLLAIFYGKTISRIFTTSASRFHTTKIILASILLIEAGMGYSYSITYKPSLGDEAMQLLEHIKSETKPDAVILAQYFISSNINTYTQRTVLLNPFWESKQIRDKNMMFDYAYLKNPSEFKALLRQYNVTHFVYNRGFYDASEYFLATKPQNSSMMHELNYHPAGIDVARIIYHNSDYILYEIN